MKRQATKLDELRRQRERRFAIILAPIAVACTLLTAWAFVRLMEVPL